MSVPIQTTRKSVNLHSLSEGQLGTYISNGFENVHILLLNFTPRDLFLKNKQR